MILNGSQIFVEVLVEQGVDTLFGYPGGAVLNLYDELYRNQDRIHHIMTAHEQGASHAADGYARATGKTGVVLATSGPGATNLVTGIATAYMDNVPMVAFTGNVGTAVLGRDAFQEAYIEGITMPITKHNYTVRRVEDLADTMREAFRIAQSGRKGPVLVDIPKDITAASCEFTPKKPAEIPVNTEVDAEDLARAAELINQATRPVVYFGGGVAVSEASCQALRDLIAKADMPATYTLMAAGVLNYGDKRNLGLIGMHGTYTANKAVDQADLVLAIGAQVALGNGHRVIHFTGDGSFHMNLNEACTAVSYELPIITIIFNNQVLGMVRQWQTAFYGKRYSSTDPERKTDYVKLAEGFGAKGYRCETMAEFRAALAEALTNEGPSWIECRIDKDEKVLPMIPPGGTVQDITMTDDERGQV